MKTTYLKRMTEFPTAKKIQSVVKITDNKALHCYNNSIEVDGSDGDDTNEYFLDFYYNLGYVTATKEEFDTMYIKAVGLVNELSKI